MQNYKRLLSQSLVADLFLLIALVVTFMPINANGGIGQIHGLKFENLNGNDIHADRNGNEIWQPGVNMPEPGLPDTAIELHHVTQEPSVEPIQTELLQLSLTGADDEFMLNAPTPGHHQASEQVPSDWTQTAPAPPDSFPDVFVEISGQQINQGISNGPVVDVEQPVPELLVPFVFSNTIEGKIKITKVTRPSGDPAVFEFVDDVTGSLSDGGMLMKEVLPGTYTVREVVPLGWDIAGVLCDDTDSYADMPNHAAIIKVSPGEEVTCTFTNTKNGKIKVIKKTRPVGDPQLFSFVGDLQGSIRDGEMFMEEVAPRTYDVREVVPLGWDIAGVSCDDADSYADMPNHAAIIKVSPGEEVTCTFTNTKNGKIIIEKQTEPDGSPDIFTFTGDVGGNLSDGQMAMTEVAPRSYSSTELLPPGWLATNISCDDENSFGDLQTQTATFNVEPGEVVKCIFTNEPSVEVHGAKFEDINGNGQKDPVDPGLAGWTIYLDANDNGSLDNGELTTITDENGEYWFMDLRAGLYHVKEVMQPGWIKAFPTSTDKYDILLLPGEIVTAKNFGNFKLGAIHGMKFNDLNGNHRKDHGEPGLADWTIRLIKSDGTVIATTTDANGDYWFMDLGPGIYVVREVQKHGWRRTTPNPQPIQMLSGQVNEDIDFGNHKGPRHHHHNNHHNH